MSDDPIFSKIRKLFSLASSSNENEAKIAMERANELLVKYNLDAQDIKSSSDYEFTKVHEGLRSKQHHSYILDLLGSFFFVRIIHKRFFCEDTLRMKNSSVLIGKPVNTKIAAHIFEFLDRTYPHLWKVFKSQYRVTEKDRGSYYHGLTLGISYVLNQSKLRVEQQKGLVVVADKDLDNFVDEYCNGKIKRQAEKKFRKSVVDKGIKDGLEVKISPALETKTDQKLILEYSGG